jgi:hypothetical protein
MTTISRQDADLIVLGMGGLPPISCSQLWTEDQKRHLEKIRRDYLVLRDELQAYFSGKPSQLTHLSQDEQEKFEAWKNVILALYEVLRLGWSCLQQSKLNDQIKTPGELLVALLEDESLGQLMPCVAGRVELNPRKLYKIKNKAEKVRDADEKAGEKVLANYKKLMKDFLPFSEAQLKCLLVCRNAAKTDRNLKRKLTAFDVASSEFEKIMYRSYRGLGAIAWQKGVKLSGQKKGGTYK